MTFCWFWSVWLCGCFCGLLCVSSCFPDILLALHDLAQIACMQGYFHQSLLVCWVAGRPPSLTEVFADRGFLTKSTSSLSGFVESSCPPPASCVCSPFLLGCLVVIFTVSFAEWNHAMFNILVSAENDPLTSCVDPRTTTFLVTCAPSQDLYRSQLLLVTKRVRPPRMCVARFRLHKNRINRSGKSRKHKRNIAWTCNVLSKTYRKTWSGVHFVEIG